MNEKWKKKRKEDKGDSNFVHVYKQTQENAHV